jgi:probable phosphoglycerate mutase
MRKLYITRHGETDFNVQNRYAGKMDILLNERGKAQAYNASEQMAELPIDVIISSTQKRALETAYIINEKLNKPLFVSELLIERDLGIFEGLTRDEVSKRYPELWESKALHELDCTEHKGESVLQVVSRAEAALQEVKESYKDKNVLLVTHGYISRMMNKVLKDLSHEEANEFLLSNCEIAEYDIV